MKIAAHAFLLAVAGASIAMVSTPTFLQAAAPPASRPATIPSATAAALYSQIIDQYLAAQWDTLPADLAKTKDLATLSKDQQADVAYIRQALAEGRPPWWNLVRQGRPAQFTAHVWQRNIPVALDPTLAPGTFRFQQNTSTGQISFSLNWPPADLDNLAIAEHGFTKADLAGMSLWMSLEDMDTYSALTPQKLSALSDPQKRKLAYFMLFRSTLTSAYYGTPRARRWAAFLSFDAFVASHATADNFIPRRPIGAMLVQEIVSHPAKYPGLRLPRNLNQDTPESSLATGFMTQFEKPLTFPQDKALREALKEFALANTTAIYDSGKITLPNKLPIPLDPAEDTASAALRNTWLKEEIAQPGVHAQTKPATK